MSDPREFSFIKLALLSLSAGFAVLVISLPLIWLAAKVAAWLGLIVALAALVGIVAAIGVVSGRMVDRTAAALTQQRDNTTPDR
ncbi:MAG: hypothetical protein QM728_08565 [Gordonia sp. (in: high G+C Gram-positive bacteria)]|uniref:hypothetical protein n=1 Tax=Gordonia sp. (in: high G+C Gram-positive bacteria) TaxID=84139 RepID=UPI0039E603A1